jgi:hypothetical protein
MNANHNFAYLRFNQLYVNQIIYFLDFEIYKLKTIIVSQ